MENRNDRAVEIGRLLSSSISEYCVAAKPEQAKKLEFGALVIVDQGGGIKNYGIVSDIRFHGGDSIETLAIVQDLPQRHIDSMQGQGVEIDVIAVGYKNQNELFQALPPRPPLGLEKMMRCSSEQAVEFTSTTHYLRHLTKRLSEPRMIDLITSHLISMNQEHVCSENGGWMENVVGEIFSEGRHSIEIADLMKTLATVMPKSVEAF